MHSERSKLQNKYNVCKRRVLVLYKMLPSMNMRVTINLLHVIQHDFVLVYNVASPNESRTVHWVLMRTTCQ